jgi:hypothetical protein
MQVIPVPEGWTPSLEHLLNLSLKMDDPVPENRPSVELLLSAVRRLPLAADLTWSNAAAFVRDLGQKDPRLTLTSAALKINAVAWWRSAARMLTRGSRITIPGNIQKSDALTIISGTVGAELAPLEMLTLSLPKGDMSIMSAIASLATGHLLPPCLLSRMYRAGTVGDSTKDPMTAVGRAMMRSLLGGKAWPANMIQFEGAWLLARTVQEDAARWTSFKGKRLPERRELAVLKRTYQEMIRPGAFLAQEAVHSLPGEHTPLSEFTSPASTTSTLSIAASAPYGIDYTRTLVRPHALRQTNTQPHSWTAADWDDASDTDSGSG